MQIRQSPSPNFGYPRGARGRNGHPIQALVIHRMQGTMAGTRRHFGSPASEASSTYGVGKDGGVEQYVRREDSPWTNGDVQGPDLSLPWLRWCLDGSVNPNEVTHTIGPEGFDGEPCAEPQYRALLALVGRELAAAGLPVGRDTIVGHDRLNSVTRARCPGRNFPWERLFRDLAGAPADLDAALLARRERELARGNGWLIGNVRHGATVDLAHFGPGFGAAARALVCEKVVLWTDDGAAFDTFHRGQYEELKAAGKVREGPRA